MKPAYEEEDTTYTPGKQFSMLSRRVKRRARKFILTETSDRRDEWKCHICGLVCAERNCLKSHLTYTHSDLAYQCPCGKAFSRPSNMRKHVSQTHPEMNPRDKSLMLIVKKSELSEDQQAVMRKLSIISRKRKIFQEPKLILPTIRSFNCYDCDGSFNSIVGLFDHCKLSHRVSEDGFMYPYLVPVAIPT